MLWCLQYCVTIHWPTSWLATKGYTSFTLGFETAEEAAQWHALVQRQLSVLRVRAVSSKGDSSTGHSSKPSYDEGLGCRSAGSGNGTVGRKTSQVCMICSCQWGRLPSIAQPCECSRYWRLVACRSWS